MDALKEVISSKVVEAATYLKGMSIHEDKVGFLGLGRNGRALAQHLLNAGVRVNLWLPADAERQISAGEFITITDSFHDVVKDVHVIFVTLDGDAIQEIAGDLEMLPLLTRKTLIVCSPLSVSESEDLNASFHRHGIDYIEAAMCGSYTSAEKTQLKIFVGSTEEQYQKVKSILSLFGTPRYAGAVPRGTAVKQAVELVLVAENVALAYAASHLHKHDIASEAFLDAMKQTRVDVLQDKIKFFEQRSYPSGGISNDDVLIGLSNLLKDSGKSKLDGKFIEVLKGYTEQAKKLSDGETDCASVYDALNPPATIQPPN